MPLSHASLSRAANGDDFLFCAILPVSSCQPAGIDAGQSFAANGATMSWPSRPASRGKPSRRLGKRGGCLASIPWEAGHPGASERQRGRAHQSCEPGVGLSLGGGGSVWARSRGHQAGLGGRVGLGGFRLMTRARWGDGGAVEWLGGPLRKRWCRRKKSRGVCS